MKDPKKHKLYIHYRDLICRYLRMKLKKPIPKNVVKETTTPDLVQAKRIRKQYYKLLKKA